MCLPFYVNQKKSENLSLLVTNVFYCIYMYAEVFVILVSFVLNICSHAADKAHRAGITVFSINKTDRYNIIEILLKVALNTMQCLPGPVRRLLKYLSYEEQIY